MKGTVICDGRGDAARTCGARAAVLYVNGKEVTYRAERIDPTTNIVAEHLAIQMGIELARDAGVTELLILNDSQTPVRHVSGEYNVRQDHLLPIVDKTWELASDDQFKKIEIKWVPREETLRADLLCRQIDKDVSPRERPGGPVPQKPSRQNPFRVTQETSRRNGHVGSVG